MVIDCFLFYNELDLLDLRLHILSDVVDKFVIVESTLTFSGLPKPLYFRENIASFEKFKDKIVHHVVSVDYDQAEWPKSFTDRQQSQSHKHHGKLVQNLHKSIQREIFQRDSISIPLENLASNLDMVLIGDVDEIPDPNALLKLQAIMREDELYHLRQQWYIYWLNNKCEKEWFGTRAFKYQLLSGKSIDSMRWPTEDRKSLNGIVIEDGGWHFSYLGGAKRIEEKLKAVAYQGKRETWTRLLNWIMPNRMQRLLKNNQDILLQGRQLKTVPIDLSFPKYLVDNIELYKSYIKV